MKRLYARFVLWLVGPALELREQQSLAVLQPILAGMAASLRNMDRASRAMVEFRAASSTRVQAFSVSASDLDSVDTRRFATDEVPNPSSRSCTPPEAA
jgi:hypothetical protein